MKAPYLTAFWLTLLMVLRLAAAQPAGSMDTNFVTVAGTDAAPNVIAAMADGRAYVGGSFTNYGGSGRAVVARLKADGNVDLTFTAPLLRKINPAVIINGNVIVAASTNIGAINAILVLADGRPVISGSFSHAGAVAAPGLVLLNLDGSVAVAAFDVNKIEPGALLAGPGNTFYLGGKGNVDTTRLPLRRFRTDGSTDAGFVSPTLASLGYAASSTAALRRGPADTFYVVTAAAVGVTPTSDILRLTSSGALDATFAGTGKAGIPFASFGSFVTDASGRLTFTGLASYRGATLNRKINRLTLGGDLDGTYLPTADPGGGRVIDVQTDGKLLFTSTSVPINRLNVDGTVDKSYANPTLVPTTVFASLIQFALAPDGSLFSIGFKFSPTFEIINGAFHILGDPQSAPIISLDPVAQTNTLGARTRFFVTAQGAAPLTYQWFRNNAPINGATDPNLVLDPSLAADDGVSFHCVVSNGQGSTPTASAKLTLLAALPGSIYRETDVPVGTDAPVADLQFDATGGLLAAGGFTKFNGTNRVRVARLINAGGLVDPAFDTGLTGSQGFFEHVFPLSSGKVIASGNLSVNYGGVDHLGSLRLNVNGSLDATFNATGVGGDGANRFSEGPGGVFVSSGFWNGVQVPGGYSRLTVAGLRDATFVPSPAFFSGAGALLALPDGKLLVAGRTNLSVNGSGVLRLNADGSQDATFYRGAIPGLANPLVSALLRQPDGKILVAGGFTTTGDFPQYTLGVIRLLANGQLDTTFNPVPALSALNGSPVLKLALQADGRILIFGAFTQVGGFARPTLARLWPNGVVDPEFSPGSPKITSVPGSVAAIAVSAANQVFVGGDFNVFEGLPRTNFARLNGGPLVAIPAPPTIANVPARVVASAGTNVTLTVVPAGAGPFQFQWRHNLQTGSSEFSDIAGATNASLDLTNLRVEDSGLFQVAIVNPGGSVFSAWIPLLVEPNPPVPGTQDRSWATQKFLAGISAPVPGGLVYGAQPGGLNRHFEDGTIDASFVAPADLVRPDNFVDNGITAMLRQPDGKLILTGRLATDGGPCNLPGNTCFEPKRGLVRLLADGSYDPGFLQTNSFAGDAQLKPLVLMLQADGHIVVGGAFQNFDGVLVAGLVRFSTNGVLDRTYSVLLQSVLPNPTRTLPGVVTTLQPLPDGKYYIGGGFTKAQGAARSGVARLNANGSLDASFAPPVMANVYLGQAGVFNLYGVGPITPAGGVYLFGQFQTNGTTYAALRLRPDGSIDDTFKVTTDFAINTGVVQTDGKLIITGQFTRLNGQPRGGFARLNVDGSTDASFTQGTTFGVGVPLTLLADGKLLAGSTRFFAGTGPVVASPELDFALKPGGLELNWSAGFKLQHTLSLTPPNWQDLVVTAPFTVPLAGNGEFFRVVPAP